MDNFYSLDKKTERNLKKINGPILIFGAGGFIGINLLKSILLCRKDVIGVSSDFKKNWRFIAADIPKRHLKNCDINEVSQVQDLLKKVKPKTIFNLAAYGAYSKQKEYNKIYKTNINSTFSLIESLKVHGFDAYVHAGSQSEYGVNSKAPRENDELIPNSHYAVSKITNYYAVKYYGKVEKLPVTHLRLYSVYGPWEEPDRLIPVLLAKARHNTLPPLVQPKVSRDFIHVNDVVKAFIVVASLMNRNIYGEAFNVGTGKKTTIRELTTLVRTILDVKQKPNFGSMQNRNWDLEEWYGNIEKIKRITEWFPTISLKEGLSSTILWQKEIGFDDAFWNPNSKTV